MRSYFTSSATLVLTRFEYPVPTVSLDIPVLLDRLCYRHPSLLVDAIAEHEPGTPARRAQERHGQRGFLSGAFSRRAADARRADARDADTGGGGAACWSAKGPMPMSRVYLHGVDDAKFRRQVVPGDRLRLDVTLTRARTTLAKARGLGVCRRSDRCRGGSAARRHARRRAHPSDGRRHERRRNRRRHDRRSQRGRSGSTSSSAAAAASARRPSSTGSPRLATRPKSFRSRRSGSSRRT